MPRPGPDVIAPDPARGIVALIDRFLAGDTSLASANALEVAIDEAFPQDEVAQDLVVALALYRPGQGTQTLGEYDVAGPLQRFRDRLRARD